MQSKLCCNSDISDAKRRFTPKIKELQFLLIDFACSWPDPSRSGGKLARKQRKAWDGSKPKPLRHCPGAIEV